MQKLATIEVIHSLSSHPNAERLEIGKIGGFQVVTKKGEFANGDKVIFVHPDTIAEPKEWNKFLQKKEGQDIKIKSVKLRGEFSTGVVLPLSVLEDGEWEIGASVDHFLGVKKYEKEIRTSSGSMNPSGNFPGFLIHKTDETNGLSEILLESDFRSKDCYFSLKCDGQSMTCIQQKDQDLIVCSRSFALKEEDNRFWNVAHQYELREKLKRLDFDVAIQGESCGPGVQGNKMQLKAPKYFVFNVKNLSTGEFLGLKDLSDFCAELELDMVPTIYEFYFDNSWDFDKCQKFADATKYGDQEGEGLVLRPVLPEYNSILGKSLSVKFINRNYRD